MEKMNEDATSWEQHPALEDAVDKLVNERIHLKQPLVMATHAMSDLQKKLTTAQAQATASDSHDPLHS